MKTSICPICNRELGFINTNRHHLYPISPKGIKTPTIRLHVVCHSMIHSAISNSSLTKRYNTAEKIRRHPLIKEFIEFIKNKPPEYNCKVSQLKFKTKRKRRQLTERQELKNFLIENNLKEIKTMPILTNQKFYMIIDPNGKILKFYNTKRFTLKGAWTMLKKECKGLKLKTNKELIEMGFFCKTIEIDNKYILD